MSKFYRPKRRNNIPWPKGLGYIFDDIEYTSKYDGRDPYLLADELESSTKTYLLAGKITEQEADMILNRIVDDVRYLKNEEY